MARNLAYQFGQYQKALEQLGYIFGGAGIVNSQHWSA